MERPTATQDEYPPPRTEEKEATPRNSNGEKISQGSATSGPSSPLAAEEDMVIEEGDGGGVKKIVSVNNMSAIPNGGTKAWLQVLGAFFLFFNSWGIVNTFGVYQTYYELQILSDQNASAIAWIGSIQSFLLMFIGALTGPIYDAGYFRPLVIAGSFAIVFGHMMLSLCTEFWQCLLAQAFVVGLGCGALFVPSVAILSTYFTTKVAFAMGLAAAGSSIGGVIYPILLRQLIPRIGFGWAVRVVGFIALVTLAIPILIMKVRVLPAQRRKLIDLHAFKEAPYALFVSGSFIGFMGLYVPFFFVQNYGIALGIVDENLGFYLLAIINSASTFGRVLPNFIADKTGPLNIIVPCAFVSGILCISLIGATSEASLIVVCVLYGFFSGTFVSVPPSVLVALSPTRGVVGTRMGMCFTVTSFGVLIGTPVAGAILGNGTDFTGTWAFGGSLAIAGGCLMLGSRIAKVGFRIASKA